MRVDTEQAKAEFKKTTGSARGFAAELRRLERQQQAVDEAMTSMGRGMVVTGAAIGLGLGLAAKAAIEWESSWAGVTKVVDGSPEQMAALEAELRGLATTLPQTHTEIAGVAAAAGQLGIAREDIVGFTQVMVAMGVATNLASEEAATALARMMNVMQTAPDDVDRLGSAVVGLGNASATTEAEIVEMALRIAGAANTVGLSEADVLGFAAALSSVGVEAEAGGSAISRAFIIIDEAVRGGGEGLEAFARVAGTTAQDFAQQFRAAPAQAMDAFIQGLGRMNTSGQDVFATLNDLGMSEILLRDALLRLAGAGDLLTESITIGNEAWDENSALMEEAAQRYGTTESQIQIARNQLNEMGIQLGQHLLPAINDFLQAGRGLFAWFDGLSDGTKGMIVQLGVATTAIGLIGGAALIAAPRLSQMSIALGEMGRQGAAKALSGVARVITGPWGAAIAAGITVFGAFIGQQAKARGQVEEFKQTLDAQTSAFTDSTRLMAAQELEARGLLETAESLGIELSTMVDALTGDPAALNAVNDAIARRREELIDLVDAADGNLTQIDAERGALSDLEQGLGDVSGQMQIAQEEHKRTAAAADLGAAAATDASAAEQVLADSLGITTDAAKLAAQGFSELEEKVRAMIDTAFAMSSAHRDVEAGIDDLTDKLAENGATFDRTTEAGRENEAAVEDLIADIAELALTTAEQTGSAEDANEVLAEQRDRLHDVLTQAGYTEDEIRDYIGVLDAIPHEIETIVEAHIQITSTERVNRIITEQYGTRAPQLYSQGGWVRGPGTSTSDSIPAMLSDGEYVVRARAAREYAPVLEAINSGRAMASASAPMPRGPSAGGGTTTVRLVVDTGKAAETQFGRFVQGLIRVRSDGDVQKALGRR